MKLEKELGRNLTLTQKICLAGIFAAIACILNKVVAINYIPIAPFVRISFGGPATIIFSSILLGPWFGALVGAVQDILGYMIFDIKSFGYAPTITTTYALLGFVSYFVYQGALLIKNKKFLGKLTIIIMCLMYITTSLIFILTPTYTYFGNTYEIPLYLKILFPILMGALLLGLILGIYFWSKRNIKHHEEHKNNVLFQSLTVSFVVEVLIMMLYGSFMKALMPFTLDLFPVILFFQSMSLYVNIFINTFVISKLVYILYNTMFWRSNNG